VTGSGEQRGENREQEAGSRGYGFQIWVTDSAWCWREGLGRITDHDARGLQKFVRASPASDEACASGVRAREEVYGEQSGTAGA
jgi:hypothetical protein